MRTLISCRLKLFSSSVVGGNGLMKSLKVSGMELLLRVNQRNMIISKETFINLSCIVNQICIERRGVRQSGCTYIVDGAGCKGGTAFITARTVPC